jgi:hypothetical protein
LKGDAHEDILDREMHPVDLMQAIPHHDELQLPRLDQEVS